VSQVIAEDELVEALREAEVDFEEANVREIFSQLNMEYGTGALSARTSARLYASSCPSKTCRFTSGWAQD
jgi:hypothetical protein